MSRKTPAFLATAVAIAIAAAATGQDRPKVGFQDTPLLPGGKWHVHDGRRPQPAVVEPGTASTQEAPGRPPSDAVVLFDGKDVSHWSDGKAGPAGWKVEGGAMVVTPKAGVVATRDEFGDCQLHLEFATPDPPRGRDQGRGNSGVMFFGRYEVQVLDSYHNPTYPDGTAGAVYGQHPPLVNAARPPGQWQSYDILFTAPRFKADGSVESPAYVTALLNGVFVQDHAEVIGAVAYRAVGRYSPHGPKGPIVLQDHGDPVKFRNIWARPIRRDDRP